MKKILLSAILIIALHASLGMAQESGMGLGIMLGEPTGISFKNWATGKTALAGGVAWSFGSEDALHIHADYLFHNFGFFPVEKGKLPFYYGLGGRIKLEDESLIGVRIPLGVNYIFQDAPLDIFLEIAPLMDLAPETEFNMNGAVGMRYFF
jgi:hypothetical protein